MNANFGAESVIFSDEGDKTVFLKKSSTIVYQIRFDVYLECIHFLYLWKVVQEINQFENDRIAGILPSSSSESEDDFLLD